MPEWMEIWGIILLGIILTGFTLAIMCAIVYGAWEALKSWAEQRDLERRLKRLKEVEKDA